MFCQLGLEIENFSNKQQNKAQENSFLSLDEFDLQVKYEMWWVWIFCFVFKQQNKFFYISIFFSLSERFFLFLLAAKTIIDLNR